MKVAQTSSKQLEEERFRLEKELARLEARFDASIQQLKDREEVCTEVYCDVVMRADVSIRFYVLSCYVMCMVR